MKAIAILGTLLFVLVLLIFLIVMYGWKKLSALVAFRKNPAQFVSGVYQLLEPFRKELPPLDHEEWSLLSAKTSPSKNNLSLPEWQSGFITNIYNEHLAVYSFKEISFNNKIYIFTDKFYQFAFITQPSGGFQVFNSASQNAGTLNSSMIYTQSGRARGSVSVSKGSETRSINISDAEVAGISLPSDNKSKVPTRHFTYIDEKKIQDVELFQLLVYASLLDRIG